MVFICLNELIWELQHIVRIRNDSTQNQYLGLILNALKPFLSGTSRVAFLKHLAYIGMYAYRIFPSSYKSCRSPQLAYRRLKIRTLYITCRKRFGPMSSSLHSSLFSAFVFISYFSWLFFQFLFLLFIFRVMSLQRCPDDWIAF